MIDDLEDGAQRIGIAIALGSLAMEVKQIAPDRVRRFLAIAEQLVKRLIALLLAVLHEGGDKVGTMNGRNPGRLHALAQRMGLGETLAMTRLAVQRGVKGLQAARLFRVGQGRIVGDVVDRAGEGVERRDMRAQRLWQEERADREILVARALAGRCLDGVCIANEVRRVHNAIFSFSRWFTGFSPDCKASGRAPETIRQEGALRR